MNQGNYTSNHSLKITNKWIVKLHLRRLVVFIHLIKRSVTPYKEYNKKEEYFNSQIRDRWYGLFHKIHQVQWMLWQVWWVEREEQFNYKAQGNPRILHKEVEYSQIIRFGRWCRTPEYIQRQHPVIGFLNNQPMWHNFFSGESVQWKCTWRMDDTHWQILIVWRKK